MKPVKYLWYVVAAILCFFFIWGGIVYCLDKWGDSPSYPNGVLIENEWQTRLWKEIEECL